jgi:hypothetical protein
MYLKIPHQKSKITQSFLFYHISSILRLQLRILDYAISADISLNSTCMSKCKDRYFILFSVWNTNSIPNGFVRLWKGMPGFLGFDDFGVNLFLARNLDCLWNDRMICGISTGSWCESARRTVEKSRNYWKFLKTRKRSTHLPRSGRL